MKIPITPDKLKPGQLFDALPKMAHMGEYQDYTFLENRSTSVIAEASTDSPAFHLPHADYDFFTEISHPELVAALVKPGEQILAEVTAEDMHLLHMLMGVCGEAGELLDALKKAIIYRKPLDRANVAEELGDLEFYLEGIRSGLKITREECLEGNIAKLAKRYSGLNYSNTAAVARADKDPLEGWTFEPPHFVNSEDCMGGPVAFHRVFAKGPNGEVTSGTSQDSPEIALQNCRENVRKKTNITL